MVTPRQFAGWLTETVSPTPLITAGTVGLVLTIAGYGGLFGLPLALLVLWGFGNFLFEVVEHRALGRADWPVMSGDLHKPEPSTVAGSGGCDHAGSSGISGPEATRRFAA